jgi:hypothetical protein
LLRLATRWRIQAIQEHRPRKGAGRHVGFRGLPDGVFVAAALG